MRLLNHISVAVFLMLCFSRITAQDVNKPEGKGIFIYLTFDDGPMEVSHFLDSLTVNDSIPIEVFVVGFRAVSRASMMQRVEMYRRTPLFEMANHSYSHASSHYKTFYGDPREVVKDILLNADTLKLPNSIVRLPGRNTWRINGRKRTDLTDANAAADTLSGMGFHLVGWDMEWKIDTCEKRYSTAEEMIVQMNYLLASKRSFEKEHVVILCHDWALTDIFFREELTKFIRQMKAAGRVKFAHLSSFPGINKTAELLTHQ